MIDRQTILNRVPEAGRWYSIRNAADEGTAVIRIFDEIGYWGVTEEQFARDLAAITADEIEVQISSPGGDVFAGIAIYNQLRAHPARVTTRVDGLAASAASFIVQAGDHRQIMSAAQMMIHEAWGLCIGPASDMREYADVLDRQSDVIAGIYASRSGGDVAEFRDLMRSDHYMSDQEALDAGLVDEIYEPTTPATDAAARATAGRRRIEAISRTTRPRGAATTSPRGQEEAMPDLSALRAEYDINDEVTDDQISDALTGLTTTDDAQSEVELPPPAPGSGAAALASAENQALRDANDRYEARLAELETNERARTRDSVLASAVREGRITPDERDRVWSGLYDNNPEGVTDSLANLPTDRFPVTEVGHSGDTDQTDPLAAAMGGLGGSLDYAELLGTKEN